MKNQLVKCSNCNNDFLKNKYEIKRSSFHFCSIKCYREYKLKNKKQTLLNCDTCKNPFYIKNKELKKSKLHFCSHSCSAKHFNPITKIKPDIACPRCDGKISYKSKLCNSCKKETKILDRESKPISSFFHKTSKYAAVKLNRIRSLARRKLELLKIKKECQICKFDIHVEVCHIKPITSFSPDTLLGVVNSKDNLIYLCPNHHYMFDKGLINLQSISDLN